jgi:GR25 family glycosyltransferase involved in LPS biosynthesis
MENIDKIYYINLDTRLDRKQEFTEQAKQYFANGILEHRIERFPAIVNERGLLGCSISHLEVIKQAKRNGDKYIIVFEDDFQFIVPRETFETNIHNLFQLVQNENLDFKVVMLSYNAMNRSPYNNLLDITTEVQTCSGYLVNSKYFDELISCWETGVMMYQQTNLEWIYCCDQYCKNLQKEKWFLFTTRIGKQRPGYSDNAKAFCDHNC